MEAVRVCRRFWGALMMRGWMRGSRKILRRIGNCLESVLGGLGEGEGEGEAWGKGVVKVEEEVAVRREVEVAVGG